MRILFSMRHTGALRNFASTLRELAQRNHRVHLVFAKQDKEGDTRLLRELTSDPRITAGEIERKLPWRFWLGVARGARYSIDYVRYLTPEFEGVTSLTARARAKAPPFMCWLAERSIFRTRAGHRLLTRALLAVERAVPIDRGCLDLVTSQRPDLLLVTPLVDIGSDQVDFVKAARRLGVRCALPVLSWDNLTNKGLIRVQPDKVFVWNEAQKREAVELHGMRPENVIVTGAMAYDQWFAHTPSSTRAEFCARVGLDPSTPVLLYLCSSPFIAPDEVGFIEQWIAAIRSAPDPRVRTAGLLIRPHPENRQPWYRFDAQAFHNVAVWPRGGASPVDATSKNDFYDSMYHAAAAIGINTSAQIECGIVGRPVFSIRTPAYRHSQEGTLHFRYLTSEGGGLLRVADDFGTHVQQLAEALDDPSGTAARVQGFVRAFTRPFGLDVAATPRIADEIEHVAAAPPPPPRRLPLTSYAVRALLIPVGGLMVVVRRFNRLTRKRRRQLRPVTVSGSFVTLLVAVVDGLFRLRAVRTVVKDHLLPHAISRLSAANAPTEEAVAARRVTTRMARHDRPIIVGPWVSEVGYELLYWIPFVRWVQTTRQIDPARLVIVSRGGAGLWYGDLGRQYLDLFDHLTPEQFRSKSEQRITDGKTKPRTMTEFDRETIKLTRQTLRLGATDVLHPMQMYRLFHSFWQSRSPIGLVDEFARWQRLPALTTGDVAGALPDDFVAVRFHFNQAFPDTEANRTFVIRLVSALSEHTDVVVLNPAVPLDDHLDVPVPPGDRVHRLDHLLSPRTNLDMQTRVIARARAFVGTHGGFSYLPPLVGVKSISFYSDAQPGMMRHLEVAKHAFAEMQPGSFTVLDVSDLDVLRAGLGTQHEAIAQLAKARLV